MEAAAVQKDALVPKPKGYLSLAPAFPLTSSRSLPPPTEDGVSLAFQPSRKMPKEVTQKDARSPLLGLMG